jgi:Fe-Mn family superoxide dismutase
MKKQLFSFMTLSLIWFNCGAQAQESPPPFMLLPLPYAKSALAPYISENTLSFHYGKHHQGYVDALNKLVAENGLKGTLEDIITKSSKDPALKAVFNNAAQDWNHTFYWSSMKPGGGGTPNGAILDLILKNFGTYDDFKNQFVDAGTKLFGSGWVWLVKDKDGSLKIVGTSNADTPLIHGQKPILVCDIWEHAYYLDYQNRRKDYVGVFLDHLVNWDFANQNL